MLGAERQPDRAAGEVLTVQEDARDVYSTIIEPHNKGKTGGSYCKKTDDRLTVILQAANQQEYYKALHVHGQKKKCEQAILARITLEKSLFPTPPSLDTMVKWLHEAIAERKALVGKNATVDHSGAGKEENTDKQRAGRVHIDFDSDLSKELDDFIVAEQEFLQEKEHAGRAEVQRDELSKKLMREAMKGTKGAKGMKKPRHHTEEGLPYDEVPVDSDSDLEELLSPGGKSKRRKHVPKPDPFLDMVNSAISTMGVAIEAEKEKAKAETARAEAARIEAEARSKEAINRASEISQQGQLNLAIMAMLEKVSQRL